MALEKKKILIVDDNEFFLKQQVACLDRERFDVQTASSGAEALETVRSFAPDLVLLDQIMEDMMGPDICRALKKDPSTSHIPIIIVSSGEKESSRLETTRAGCNGIIFKPIRRNQLLSLVEEYLGVGFRKWERARAQIPCKIHCDSKVDSGQILSLGGGGVFVTDVPAMVRGDTCQLLFSLPGDLLHITVREAIVVWTGLLNSTEIEGVGLKFLTIGPDEQQAIDNYVAEMVVRRP